MANADFPPKMLNYPISTRRIHFTAIDKRIYNIYNTYNGKILTIWNQNRHTRPLTRQPRRPPAPRPHEPFFTTSYRPFFAFRANAFFRSSGRVKPGGGYAAKPYFRAQPPAGERVVFPLANAITGASRTRVQRPPRTAAPQGRAYSTAARKAPVYGDRSRFPVSRTIPHRTTTPTQRRE